MCPFSIFERPFLVPTQRIPLESLKIDSTRLFGNPSEVSIHLEGNCCAFRLNTKRRKTIDKVLLFFKNCI